MSTTDLDKIHYVADEAGHQTAAVVPIDVWRDIRSELETRYLLDNPVMRERLRQSINSTKSVSLDEALRHMGVTAEELEDEVD